MSTAERKRILLDRIYGVDIDPQAVEVTKLSLLLKVLEGETKETLQRQLFAKERAQPDLSDNIKCGNSLIGPDFCHGKQLALFDDEQRLRVSAFDWTAEFREIMQSGGFDTVVGNPPYVRMEAIKAVKDYLREHYESHEERVDLYSYFVERAVRLVKTHGLFGMIISNKFIQAKDGRPLRRVLCQRAKITRLTDFAGANVFAGATVRTIVVFATPRVGSGVETEYVPVPNPETMAAISAGRTSVSGHAESAKFHLTAESLSADSWRLIPATHLALLSRLKNGGVPLSKHYGIRATFGVKTGLNGAFVIDDEGFLVNDKMFVLPVADPALVGVLNSRVANFYFGCVCAALEGSHDRYLEFRAQYVDPFPIPSRVGKASRKLAPLVQQMHRLCRASASATTPHEQTAVKRQMEATDRQIDGLVYEPYGLTDDEIRIVEESTAALRR